MKRVIHFILIISILFGAADICTAQDGISNADALIEKQLQQLSALNESLASCDRNGISTDYETMYRNVIERFLGYMKEEAGLGSAENLAYYDAELDKLYNLCMKNISDYRNKTKAPFDVPKYKTGDVSLSGQNFAADAVCGGKTEKRPVFLYGYGHWDHVRDEIADIPNFGANFAQIETNLNQLLVEASPVKGWMYRKMFDTEGAAEIDNAVFYGGTASLKITKSGKYVQNNYICIYQDVYVKPNTRYEFGLKAKADKAEGCWFGFGPTKDISRVQINGTYGWKEYKSSYTTGEDENLKNTNYLALYPNADCYHTSDKGAWLRFCVYAEGDTRSVNIDNCYVRESGTDVNLLENGDFEGGAPQEAQDGFMFNEKVLSLTLSALERAEKANVRVDVNLSLHQLNDMILYSYKKQVPTSGITWSLGYDILNPGDGKILKAYEYYVRNLIKKIKGYKSLNSICLTNEANYYSNKSAAAKAFFEDYLKEKYGSIDALNNVYSTSYTGFASVQMPQSTLPDAAVGGQMLFEDWRQFNDDVFTQFHAWLADIIKEEAPDVFVHTKLCANMFPSDQDKRNYLTFGANPEKFASFSDLNGNDAGNKIENRDIVKTMMFYNLQTSIKNAPVINSENHIIADNDMSQNPLYADNADANLWQGAVNGLGATAVWMWDRAQNKLPKENVYGSLILNRPDVVARIGKTIYDVNRMSYEIKALGDEKAQVALLYSDHTRSYSKPYMNILYKTYEQLIFSGMKVGFVTDSSPETLDNYDFVIVPNTTNIPEETIDGLCRVVDRGGRIVVIGEDSLKRNEKNVLNDRDKINKIIGNSVVIPISVSNYTMSSPSEGELGDALLTELESAGKRSVVIKYSDTNEPPDKLCWQSALYNGNLLINICSYDYDNAETRPLSVYINGKKAESFTELRDGSVLNDGFKARLLKPILLSVPAETDDLSFEPSNVLATSGKNAICISWRNPAVDSISKVALYEGDTGNLIKDDFCTDEDSVCRYTVENLTDYTLKRFRLVFSFDNHEDIALNLTGYTKRWDSTKLIESPFTDWSLVFSDHSHRDVPVKITADANEKYDLGYSMHIASNLLSDDKDDKVAIKSDTVLEAGEYEVTFRKKSVKATPGSIYLNLPDSETGEFIQVAAETDETGSDWTSVTKRVTLTKSENPCFTVTSGPIKDFWIDAVDIRKISDNGSAGSQLLLANGWFNSVREAPPELSNVVINKEGDKLSASWDALPSDVDSINIYIKKKDGNLRLRSILRDMYRSVTLPAYENGEECVYVFKTVNRYNIESMPSEEEIEPLEISDVVFEDTGAEESCGMNVAATVKNNTEQFMPLHLILAEYSGETAKYITGTSGFVGTGNNNKKTFRLSVPCDAADDCSIRLFLWNSLQEMNPYDMKEIPK